jgi:asparagine synthase (glutamine-hydrolysing)
VANGEIYNYLELREELIGQGRQFHSGSDSETIVHA